MTDGPSTKRVHIVDCEWKEACEIEAHWASPLSAEAYGVHPDSDLGLALAYWAKHRAVGRPIPDVEWFELDLLLAEVAALQAQVDALTRERDELRAALTDARRNLDDVGRRAGVIMTLARESQDIVNAFAAYRRKREILAAASEQGETP